MSAPNNNRLHVFFGEEMIGVLESGDGTALTFKYNTADPRFRLSLSLPIRSEGFTDQECRPYFAGLLPEGVALERMAAKHRLSVTETFKLLRAQGAECAGAVRLLRPDADHRLPRDYRPLDDAAMAAMIEDIAGDPLLASDRRVRMSVAGAQPKAAIALLDGKPHKPENGSPSTHIIKVWNGDEDTRTIVENEAFCMQLAARCGITTAPVLYRRYGGRSCLLVQRFDREVDASGHVIRLLHQEDFAQAMGVLPARKYEYEGIAEGRNPEGQTTTGVGGALLEKTGPGLDECLALLNRTQAPLLARGEFLRLTAFNWLIANADAHAKNFSLFYPEPGKAPMLAPAYDLLCTRIYRISMEIAMAIGGEVDPERVTADGWKGLFRQKTLQRSILTPMVKRVFQQADELQSERPFPGSAAVVESIVRVIAQRTRDLGGALGIEVEADRPLQVNAGGGWGRGS